MQSPENVNENDHGIDPDVVRRFVALLRDTPDPIVHWRLLPDSNAEKARTSKVRVRKNFSGTVADLLPEMALRQRHEWGVYLIVNEGGHSKADITKIVAQFIDADDRPLPQKWHVDPSFIVQRDATHWHAYWRVSDVVTPDEFTVNQLRLAKLYGGDPQVADPSRIMRVPGTWHLKTGQWERDKVKLIEGAATAPRPVDVVMQGVPAATAAMKRQKVEGGEAPEHFMVDAPNMIAHLQHHLAKRLREGRTGKSGVDRNKALFDTACLAKEMGVSRYTAEDLIDKHFNQKGGCTPQLDRDEETWKDAFHSAYVLRTSCVFGSKVDDPQETFAHFAGMQSTKEATHERENASDTDPASPAEGSGEEAGSPGDDPLKTWEAENDPQDVFAELIEDELPAFPALSPVISAYAKDEAERKGVDEGPVAFSMLVVCSSVLHMGFQIQVTNDSTRLRRGVLWGALMATSGDRKSPIFEAALAPLHLLQRKINREFKREWSFYQSMKLTGPKRQIAQKFEPVDGPLSQEDGEKIEVIFNPVAPEEAPKKRHLLFGNSTVEGIVKYISENSGWTGLNFANEWAKIIKGFDQYHAKGGNDRQAYIEAWDCEPLSQLRATGSIECDPWGFPILGGIQPDVIKNMAKDLEQDGLLQRFLFCPLRKPRKGEERDANRDALDGYTILIERLAALKPNGANSIIRMSPEARVHWLAVEDQIEAAITEHRGAHPTLVEALNKFDNQFARVLLVLHAIDSVMAAPFGETPKMLPFVTGETAARARFLTTQFLIPAAERFYLSVFKNPAEHWSDAQKIAYYILVREKKGVLRPREIYDARKEFRADYKRLQLAMSTLCEWGWTRPKSKLLDRITEWDLNPKVADGRFTRYTDIEQERAAAAYRSAQAAREKRRLERRLEAESVHA